MHIGIVLSQTPGYSETFFTSKIKGLQAAGFKVTLFVQKHRPEFTLCPVEVAPKVRSLMPLQLLAMGVVFTSLLLHLGTVKRFITLERNEGTTTAEILKKVYLNAHILKAKLDWLHFGFATMAVGSECVAKAIGAKMGFSFRGFDMNIFPLKHPGIYNLVWKHVDKVHSISTYLYNKAKSYGLSAETPYEIITPAVAIDSLPSGGIPNSNTLEIVTIARLNWIKGLHTIIAAVELLRDAGHKITYHIIGDGEPKEKERYTFQVHEAGLQDVVFFYGKLTHRETLEKLQHASVYVQPSLNEGFCNAVLEAQAMGKLVLASDVGGLPENIVHNETGWLFPVENEVALATQLEYVLSLSAAEKKTVSEAAKQRVKKYFAIEQQQKSFVSFYKTGT